jgi:hypothetical protein
MENPEESTPTKILVDDVPSSPATPPARVHPEQPIDRSPPKTLSFYLSFLSLNLLVFIVSVDATALGVAIPVRMYQIEEHFLSEEQKLTTREIRKLPRSSTVQHCKRSGPVSRSSWWKQLYNQYTPALQIFSEGSGPCTSRSWSFALAALSSRWLRPCQS